MKLTLNKKYLSLQPFTSDELNDLTIITGLNGSGKTQLIKLIEEYSKFSLADKKQYPLYIEPIILDIQIGNSTIEQIPGSSNEIWKTKMHQYYSQFIVYFRGGIWDSMYEMAIPFVDIVNIITLIGEDSFTEDETLDPILVKYDLDKEQFNQISYLSNLNFDYLEVAFLVAEFHKKKLHLLTESDFQSTPLSAIYFDSNSLFGSSISNIFYSYIKARFINEFLWFRKQQYNDDNNSIDSNTYKEIHPEPWRMLNEILKQHKLDYYFKDYPANEFNPDVSINHELKKISTDELIHFSELSSGEKIIMSLIVRLFTINFYKDNLHTPQLIILDEPDAHLHPGMTKIFIDVVHKTFVKELGMKVIMTTHSPSTVALAPGECIYRLQNGKESSLKKIEKDDALKLLTEYLPLNIDYKNHRQIFVEGPIDLSYYQMIFEKLSEVKKYPYKLYFISSEGGISCDKVIQIVSDMTASGSSSCYGIIDWDSKNKEVSNIKVHGVDSRNNIESFIYDPSILAVYLIQNKHNDFLKTLKIDEHYNEFEILKDQNLLQKSVDFIWKALVTKYPDCTKNELRISKSYYNSSIKLEIPQWYFTQFEKTLKERIENCFPVLQSKNKNEIERKLIAIMAKTRFFPIESAELIETLAL
jgi:predicted ATPase